MTGRVPLVRKVSHKTFKKYKYSLSSSSLFVQ